MNPLRHIGSNTLALLSILAVLTIVFGTLVGGLAYYQKSQDRIEAHDSIERETLAIGAYVIEATLRNDYRNIISFVNNWGKRHQEITRITVQAPNGFEIVSYNRATPAGIPITDRHVIVHASREIATVEQTYDITNLLDQRSSGRLRLIPYIAAFAAVLGIILWVALQRLVLMPMQRIDAQLASTAQELAGRNRELHQALSHAEIANKTKSDFLSSMSHELRTPLNAVIGFSGMIKEEIFGPLGNDQYRGYMDDIHNSGQHLLELINDVLDVSAIEAGALELHEDNVTLTDIVEASIHFIQPRADDGQVSVSASIDLGIPPIYADGRRVKQILLNLLSNAVKFTPEEGEISVSARLDDNGLLGLTVADTGVGMDEEEIKTALSRFGQVDSGLDRKHEGTGLGLPLTKGLMELHGGTLEIQSEKGHGTRITVTFPKERIVQNVC